VKPKDKKNIPTQNEIEAWVTARETARALSAISAWVIAHKRVESSSIQAANWLRRLGRYSEALRVLVTEKDIPVEGRRRLWIGYILNLMGASEWAIRMVENLKVSQPEDHLIKAMVFADNNELMRALPHFEAYLSRPLAGVFKLAMAKLAAADTYAFLDRFAEAHALLDQVAVNDKSEMNSLLQGIVLQARGEYYAREKRFAEALGPLEEAESFFPMGENTIDRVILYKWRGYARWFQNRRDEALTDFEAARKMIMDLRLRPEVWVDLQRIKYDLKLISEEEWARAYYFPGLTEGYRKFVLSNHYAPPSPCIISLGGSKKDTLVLDLSHEDSKVNGKLNHGLTKEEILLASLVVAYPQKVSWVRLKSVLWPDQLFNFMKLENRLFALMRRLESEFKIKAYLEDGMVSLGRSEKFFIQVRVGPDLGPRFLHEIASEQTFKTCDLELFYDLSPSRAKELLLEWKKMGLIEAFGRARLTYYRKIPSP